MFSDYEFDKCVAKCNDNYEIEDFSRMNISM
jgi:hypothetical protein